MLIDGRTVYSPASGGVFWDAQDLMLQDVDRIEVIRGPGATLWGANAMNGVINITTKRAQTTQGALVTGSLGNIGDSQAAMRVGGVLTDAFAYRVYAKYLDQGALPESAGSSNTGDWRSAKAGFRIDSTLEAADSLTLQGDVYTVEAGSDYQVISAVPPTTSPTSSLNSSDGGNILGRWTHRYSADSSLTLQGYVDHSIQADEDDGLEHRNTYDLDLQQRLGLGSANDFLWGSGFRLSTIDEVPHNATLTWNPANRDIRLYNFFVQDEWTAIPDRLHMTVGSKVENSNIAGWNTQPNLRVAWTPIPATTVWAAISRAVRTPDLAALGLDFNIASFPAPPGGLPGVVQLQRNPTLTSEQLLAYEAGLRFSPIREISFDVSGFDNHYKNAIIQVPGAPRAVVESGQSILVVPVLYDNDASALTHGMEISAHWQALSSWQVSGSYTWLHVEEATNRALAWENPSHQFQLRSYADLPGAFQLNAAVYHVETISTPAGGTVSSIPAYTRADLGLVWKRGAWSVGVWGKNILEWHHEEFGNRSTPFITEVPRSVIGQITWNH